MKLLIVTVASSIHAARWVNQLEDTGWQVHVFQGDAAGSLISPEFRFGTIHVARAYKPPPGVSVFETLPKDGRGFGRLKDIGRRLRDTQPQVLHELYLKRLIEKLKPDIIHSLGLNINWRNMCLPVMRVRSQVDPHHSIPWLYSTWGSDLSYFSSLSEENDRSVRKVLKECDYLATEHRHDHDLAEQMGFDGAFVGYFTGFGGVRKEHIKPLDSLPLPSSRRIILLKGRDQRDDDPVGRAYSALEAFKSCEPALKGFRVVIVGVQWDGKVAAMAAYLRATTDLDIQVLPYVSYEHLIEIYQASRVFISLTVNDGVPSSLIEAMSSGALPICSDLEPTRELITDGKNGLLVPPEDRQAIARAIERAIGDDTIVDEAAAINHQIIMERFTHETIGRRVIDMYVRIKEEKPVRRGHTAREARE